MIDTLKNRLNKIFPDASIDLQSADQVHFTLTIIDSCFTQQPLLARHRMVYDAIEKDLMDNIHALSINTLTPEELEQKEKNHG